MGENVKRTRIFRISRAHPRSECNYIMKALTKDGVPMLLSAKGGSHCNEIANTSTVIPDSGYKLVLQIDDIATPEVEAFDMWISDGVVQEKCTVHTRYNNQFTSGEIVKYSIIQITKSRVVALENVLTHNEVLIVDECRLVDRLISSTIHLSSSTVQPPLPSTASTTSTTQINSTQSPYPIPSMATWTDQTIPYARPRGTVNENNTKATNNTPKNGAKVPVSGKGKSGEKGNDKRSTASDEPLENRERVRDFRPLVGGRMHYVCEFCDEPDGPLTLLPLYPRDELHGEDEDDADDDNEYEHDFDFDLDSVDIDGQGNGDKEGTRNEENPGNEGEDGGEEDEAEQGQKRRRPDEGSREEASIGDEGSPSEDSDGRNKENKKNKQRRKKYKLHPIFEHGDIVAADDFKLPPRLDLASVNKRANKRKKNAQSRPSVIVGVVTCKSSIITYGASTDISLPMKFTIILTDTSGSLPVVFWNAMCKYFHYIEVGQVLAINKFVVKKQYGGDGIELAVNVSNPAAVIQKLKRKHFLEIPLPRIAYHFVPLTFCPNIPDGHQVDCVGVVVSRSASERRRIMPALPITASYFCHYVWVVLLNPPSALGSSDGFPVRVATSSQHEIFNSLAAGQIVAITHVRVASVTVDSIHPRQFYGTSTRNSRIYQIEGPFSDYTPPEIRELDKVKEVVDWYGMGGWDNTMNNLETEDYNPHYVWYPTLSLYVLNVQSGLLSLKPFGTIEGTKSSLKLKEKADMLVQCTIAGIKEDVANFTLKLLDINKQHNMMEVTLPHAILNIAARYYQLPPNATLLCQLEYFIHGESSDVNKPRDLMDKIANNIYVCGLELSCISWQDYTIDIVCFYKPNT